MKEKDVDKLFQEAAKKASIGNPNEGWAAMESKLKGAGMVTGTKPRSWFNLNTLLIILLFLIGGGVGTIWYLSGPQDDSGSEVVDNANETLENEVIMGLDESNSEQSNQLADNGQLSNKNLQDSGTSLEKDHSELTETGFTSDSEETGNLETDDISVIVSDSEGEERNDNFNSSNASAMVSLNASKTKTNSDHLEGKEGITTSSLLDEVSTKSNTSLMAGDSSSQSNIKPGSNDNLIARFDEKGDQRVISKEEDETNLRPDDSAVTQDDQEVERTDHSVITKTGDRDKQKSDSTFFAGPSLLLPISGSFSPELHWHFSEIKPVENTKVVMNTQADQDSTFKRSRWSVGLELSPDLSTVGLRGAADPGYTVGLHGEYHFSSKWSLSGGLGYSKKIYFADEGIESYPGTNPNWTLDRVDANCDVIDIPINVSYYLNGYEKSGFVFGAGLSTYFMLTENYDIIYDNPWPEGAQFFRNENQHFLGILNASVGYRKRLSSVLSLQAEPYLKIPIQGIGAGELDLYTSGLRLTLKYNRVSKQ